jgi:hypothetical protein
VVEAGADVGSSGRALQHHIQKLSGASSDCWPCCILKVLVCGFVVIIGIGFVEALACIAAAVLAEVGTVWTLQSICNPIAQSAI